MGIFDSIMGNNKPAPAPAPAPVAQVAEKPVEPVNPLDVYKNMFDTSKNAAAEDVAPAFKLDDKVLSEVSGKL